MCTEEEFQPARVRLKAESQDHVARRRVDESLKVRKTRFASRLKLRLGIRNELKRRYEISEEATRPKLPSTKVNEKWQMADVTLTYQIELHDHHKKLKSLKSGLGSRVGGWDAKGTEMKWSWVEESITLFSIGCEITPNSFSSSLISVKFLGVKGSDLLRECHAESPSFV